MKPFDLEAAKSGKKVVTRDGKAVRVVCFDMAGTEFCVLALIPRQSTRESLGCYTAKGKFSGSEESSIDLFMASEIEVRWVNIYPQLTDYAFVTKEKADSFASPSRVACVRVEYEI